MARGRDDFADGIVDEKVSISNYSLSASVACGKVRVLSAHSFQDSLGLSYLSVLLCARGPLGHCVKFGPFRLMSLATHTPSGPLWPPLAPSCPLLFLVVRSTPPLQREACVSCFRLAILVFNHSHVFQHTSIVPSSPILFLDRLDARSHLSLLYIRTLTIRTMRCITTPYLPKNGNNGFNSQNS